MKTSNTTKRLLTALVSFTLLAVTASAKPPVKINNPLSVKYIGIKNDYLIFKVTVRTNKLIKPELFVDESSHPRSLYWKKFSGTTKVKWVKIKNSDNLNLYFELVSRNKSYYKTFNTCTAMIPRTMVLENKDVAVN
jgi:hypothetical protein